MAASLNQDVGLSLGLRALADELPSSRAAAALRLVTERLEAGDSLETALQAPGSRLPEHVRGLVRAGVQRAEFAASMEDYIHWQRSALRLRRQLRLMLLYPAILLGMMGVMLFVYQNFYVRQLVEIYDEFGMELPLGTKAIFAASLIPIWVWLTGCGLLVAAAIVVRLPPVRPWSDRLFRWIPGVGKLWHWLAVAEMVRLLALLLESRVPLPQALSMTAGGLSDRGVASECQRLVGRTEAGESLWQAVAQTPDLPRGLVPMIGWGEPKSLLPEALRAAGEMFEGGARMQLALLRTFLPLLTIAVVAGMFMLIASTILFGFLPLMRLI